MIAYNTCLFTGTTCISFPQKKHPDSKGKVFFFDFILNFSFFVTIMVV